MNKTYYLGLDVHKETISIAYALEGSREKATYYGKCGGSRADETAPFLCADQEPERGGQGLKRDGQTTKDAGRKG